MNERVLTPPGTSFGVHPSRRPRTFAAAPLRVTVLTISLVMLAALVCPPEANAQYRRGRSASFFTEPWSAIQRTHGYLGFRGVGMIIADEATDFTDGYLGNGGGLGLFAGVKLSPVVSLELNWNTTWHDQTLRLEGFDFVLLDSLNLMTFTADLKLHFPTPSIVDPFLLLGAGYARIGADYNDGFSFDQTFADGATFEMGGGLNVWLSPHLSLGGQIYYRGMYLDEPDYDIRWPRYDNYISGLIFDADLTVHL